MLGQHGELRPRAQTHRDGCDRYFAKMQVGLRRGFHVFSRFLQIREDLSVHGDLRRRDEAVGCFILFNPCLPVPGADGARILAVACSVTALSPTFPPPPPPLPPPFPLATPRPPPSP